VQWENEICFSLSNCPAFSDGKWQKQPFAKRQTWTTEAKKKLAFSFFAMRDDNATSECQMEVRENRVSKVTFSFCEWRMGI